MRLVYLSLSKSLLVPSTLLFCVLFLLLIIFHSYLTDFFNSLKISHFTAFLSCFFLNQLGIDDLSSSIHTFVVQMNNFKEFHIKCIIGNKLSQMNIIENKNNKMKISSLFFKNIHVNMFICSHYSSFIPSFPKSS